MWGRNKEVCWGVGEVSGIWGSMGGVEECMGKCADCGEVCWDVERCGKVWGKTTHSSTLPHTLHIQSTPLPTLI